MTVENLTITRIVAHEVFRRNDDRTLVPPNYGVALTALSAKASEVLGTRIIKAMSSNSKSMEMVITSTHAVAIGEALLVHGLSDADFVDQSKAVADLLAGAQISRQLPGGILVTLQGTVGYPARAMVAFIKAEVQEGFRKKVDANGGITAEFLNDLFLTPEAKLYKIGMFVSPVAAGTPLAGWHATVYDAAMTSKERGTAAHYFYNGFLGCDFPDNAAKSTKQFHDLSREFISRLDVPEEQKSDLHNALVTYLKVDNSPTIQVSEFANSFLPSQDVKDAFVNYMDNAGFSNLPLPKDISELTSFLRFRKVEFSHNIKLTAPAENFGDFITIETVDGDVDPHGNVPTWTRILVKAKVQHQS